MIRWHVISAVFWRNVKQFFTSVLGYLFIVVFVSICALLAFNRQFFIDNLATLDQLSQYYPLLLLFIVPAITMGIWADERRQGTDAILFTLPASDLEILLGKYLAVVAVYSIALLFSLTQLITLGNIGSPDWGVVTATYLGYWLAGCALLAIGMIASALTASNTIAFILGAALGAVPVLIGNYYQGTIGIERLGFAWNLRDFQLGQVTLSGLFYFLSIIVLALYINLVIISYRHWAKARTGEKTVQFALRTAGLAAALVSANVLVQQATAALPTRLDLTRDRLYTLDQSTRQTLASAAAAQKPVTIQAYVSDNVPREYVPAKNYFLGLLRQFERVGGNNVTVEVKTVKPSSAEAAEARTHGVLPTTTTSEIDGRRVQQDVFMGAYVFGADGDAVVPRVDSESSIEYELTRAIANTTNKKKRLRVGVLTTDLFFLGPLVRDKREDWAFNWALKDLSKIYDFRPVSAEELKRMVQPAAAEPPQAEGTQAAAPPPAPPLPDVLMVVGPSCLPQGALEDLVRFVAAGHPTLILEDPLPFYWTFISPDNLGVLNAPREPRVGLRSPARPYLTEYSEEKAFNGTPVPLLAELGIDWNNGRVAWHELDSLPGFKANWPPYLGETWPAYYGAQKAAMVFAHPRGEYQPFNRDNEISRGLRRMLFFYPGSIQPAADAKTNFVPLVELLPVTGTIDWDKLTFTPNDPRMPGASQKMVSDITDSDLVVLAPDPPLRTQERSLTIAAHLTGKDPNHRLNVVFIADTDFLSEIIPYQQKSLELPLDNLKLVQNALEVLAGDSEFVRLRNRQPSPRSLTKFESLVEQYRLDRVKKQEAKESEIMAKLSEEQKRLDEAAKKISEDKEMDMVSRVQELMKQSSEAQQRFDVQRRRLEREREQEISKLKGEELQKISRTEGTVRLMAVLLAPLPAVVLGVYVLSSRFWKEKSQIKPERRK